MFPQGFPQGENGGETNRKKRKLKTKMKITIKDFVPSHTFDCGQCFRWEKEEGESYVGVAGGKAVRIKEQNGNIEISSTEEEYSSFWENYLDAKRDYGKIKKQIEELKELVKAYQTGLIASKE